MFLDCYSCFPVLMRDQHSVLPSLLSQPSASSSPLSKYFNVPCTITSNSIARVPETSGFIVVTFDMDTQSYTTVFVVVYCQTGMVQLAI